MITLTPRRNTGDCAIDAHLLQKVLIEDVAAAGDDLSKLEKQLTLTLIKSASGSHFKSHHSRYHLCPCAATTPSPCVLLRTHRQCVLRQTQTLLCLVRLAGR